MKCWYMLLNFNQYNALFIELEHLLSWECGQSKQIMKNSMKYLFAVVLGAVAAAAGWRFSAQTQAVL